MVFVYARSENGKKIVLLEANRESLRCRQRNKNMDNSKENLCVLLVIKKH